MLNPCAFALLPTFLSLHFHGSDTQPAATSARTLHAILAALTVTTGALSIFAVVGVPIALGAGQIAAAIPWAGLALGLILAAIAVLTLAGKKIPLPDRAIHINNRRRGVDALLVFGAGYAAASLSCTLPIFLAVIGASLTTHNPVAALAVFAGYALGIAAVLTTLAIGAALLRDGVIRTLTGLRLRRLNGDLLLLVGAYLTYFWATALFSSAGTRAHDPLITATEQLTNHIQQWATTSLPGLLLTTAGIVTLALLHKLWRWATTGHDHEPDARPTHTQPPT